MAISPYVPHQLAASDLNNSLSLMSNQINVNFKAVLGAPIRHAYFSDDGKSVRLLTDIGFHDFEIYGDELVHVQAIRFPVLSSRVYGISINTFRTTDAIYRCEEARIEEIFRLSGILTATISEKGLLVADDKHLYFISKGVTKKSKLPVKSPAFIHLAPKFNTLFASEKWVIENLVAYSTEDLREFSNIVIPDGRHFQASTLTEQGAEIWISYGDIVYRYDVKEQRFDGFLKQALQVQIASGGFFSDGRAINRMDGETSIKISDESPDAITTLASYGGHLYYGTMLGGFYKKNGTENTSETKLLLPPSIISGQVKFFIKNRRSVHLKCMKFDLECDLENYSITVLPQASGASLDYLSPLSAAIDHDRIIVRRYGEMSAILGSNGFVQCQASAGKIWFTNGDSELFVSSGESEPQNVLKFATPVREIQVCKSASGFAILARSVKSGYTYVKIGQDFTVQCIVHKRQRNLFLLAEDIFLGQNGSIATYFAKGQRPRVIGTDFFPIVAAAQMADLLYVCHCGNLEIRRIHEFNKTLTITASENLSVFSRSSGGDCYMPHLSNGSLDDYISCWRKNMRPVEEREKKAALFVRQEYSVDSFFSGGKT